MAAAAGRHRRRAARRHSSIIYGIWGLFVFAPFLQETLQPFLITVFGEIPILSSLFEGTPNGANVLTASIRSWR